METATTPTAETIVARDTDALAAVFTQILRDSQVDPRRLLRAATLLDDVERIADGRWICPASNGKAAHHIVNGLCNCSDATYRDPRRCAHALAVQAYQLLERAEAEAGCPADPDPDEEIPFVLTPRAIAILEPHRECSACADTAADHDGPEGQCTRHGADAEGWWSCDCRGFATDDAA
jgi:hypothetical protein